MIGCYNCQKLSHVIVECLKTKNKLTTSKKPYKKKVLRTTWDTESESEEEVDTANVCFMTNENTPKVFPESSLEDYDLTMEELEKAFEELSSKNDFLKNKFLKTEKENELLQNQLLVVSKGKESLFISLQNTQKYFDAYKISCKAQFSCFDEDEISLMKNQDKHFDKYFKEM